MSLVPPLICAGYARVGLTPSFVAKRFDHDPRWAETGDRYLIKLFRDFVFHQVDENGRPVTDLTHVLTQLNKLDAGVDEKIMLVSRDEASCLIVSFREVSPLAHVSSDGTADRTFSFTVAQERDRRGLCGSLENWLSRRQKTERNGDETEAAPAVSRY